MTLEYKDSPNISKEFRELVAKRSAALDKELSEEQAAIDRCSEAEEADQFFDLLSVLNPRVQMALIEVAATATPQTGEQSYLRKLSEMQPFEAIEELSRWDTELARTFAHAWSIQERQFLALGLPGNAMQQLNALQQEQQEQQEQRKAIESEDRSPKREPLMRRVIGAFGAFAERLKGER